MTNSWVENLPEEKRVEWLLAHGDKAMEEHYTFDPYFALWLHFLNRACMRRAFVSYRDLEDWDYWSAYEADMSPVEACREMLAANGYPMEDY